MPNPYDKYAPPGSLEELFPSTPREPRPRRVGPLHRRPVPPEEPEVSEQPAEAEEPGWFQKYAPHAVRGIGGLFGITPATGAVAGGVADVIAQGIEQGDWTPDINRRQVAAEMALGGVGGGFAKLLGAGLTSVARAAGAGALLGGSAPVIRHGIEEGEWDPREYAGEIGTSAAIGGTVGGGLAKLFQKLAPSRPAGPASRYEVETTAVPGGQTLGSGQQKTQYVTPVRPIHGTGAQTPAAAPAPTTRVPYDAADAARQPVEREGRIPYMGGDVALLPSQERLIATEARAAERMAREAEKAVLEAKKLEELQRLLQGRGAVEARVSESVSAVDPITGHRLGATFREVAEEGSEGGGGVLARQGDGPKGPAGGDLQAEIERIKQELAEAQAVEPPPVASTVPPGPMARLNELRDKAQAGTLTGDELAEARLLDADLRGRGFPPDEPPLAGSPVAVGPEPPAPPSSGGLEAPIPAQAEASAPSPLETLLGGKQPGKGRAKRARKSKSERFDEQAAKIAAQAEAPVTGPTPQDLQEFIRGQHAVAPGLTRSLQSLDIQSADPRFQLDLLQQQLGRTRAARIRNTPVDIEALDREIAALGAQVPKQSLQELLSQVPESNKSRIYTPEGMVEGPVGSDPTDMLAALRSEAPAPALSATPEPLALPAAAPEVSAPAAPPDLLQILRTRVGATGKNYRLAREAAKAGEIPSADLAREAHLREQAALRGAAPVGPAVPEAPTAAPASWMDNEAAAIERLSQLPKEQRLAAFLGEDAPIPPTSAASDVPMATVEAPGTEPEWVAKVMAEVNELAQQKTAQLDAPVPKPPVSTVAELIGANQPLVPPTAEQIAELQALRQQSGAIESPSDVPSWLQSQVQAAPETPPEAAADLAEQIAQIRAELGRLKGKKGKGGAPAEPPPPTILTKPSELGKPRLNKPGKYGGHEGPPNPQDYRPKPPGERGAYPTALAVQLALGAAGATIGGATDPLDDPLLSAMAGGAVGLSLPTMAQGLMRLGATPDVVQNALQDLNLPDGARRAAVKIGRVLPQVQRANYLADIIGLGANAWFGPYGSGVFGALEKGLAGDPRGWAVLRELKNPWNFFKEYPSAYEEARALVGRAEGFSEAEAVGALEKRLTMPGTLLTAGDVAIRRILERHGFSEAEARIMTMTGEPFTKSGESFAHLRGFIPDITFPFKRTPINIAEQGLLRTPGWGFLQQGIGAARGTRAADPLSVQLAQQGMGLGIAAGGEQLGEHLDPETARVLRRFVTNFAGPYSLLAGAGLAAGQAVRRGQPVVGTTIRNTTQQLPMPSIEPIQEVLGLGGKLLDQGPSAIEGRDIPRGAYPAGLVRTYQQLEELLNPPQLPPRRRRSAP